MQHWLHSACQRGLPHDLPLGLPTQPPNACLTQLGLPTRASQLMPPNSASQLSLPTWPPTRPSQLSPPNLASNSASQLSPPLAFQLCPTHPPSPTRPLTQPPHSASQLSLPTQPHDQTPAHPHSLTGPATAFTGKRA